LGLGDPKSIWQDLDKQDLVENIEKHIIIIIVIIIKIIIIIKITIIYTSL